MIINTLSQNSIHIWYGQLPEKEVDSDSFSLLSEDEQTRTRRFVFDRDRNRYAAGRVLLRKLLSCYTGIAPDKLIISYNSFGKPFITNEITFNLSHSENALIITFANCRDIGVDIEKKRTFKSCDDVAKMVFSSEEYSSFEMLSEVKKIDFFFRIWTRKEALLKAVGCGLTNDMTCIQLSGTSGEAAVSYENKQWRITPVETILPEFTASVCCEISGNEELAYCIRSFEEMDT